MLQDVIGCKVLLLSALVFVKQYVGNAIDCYLPESFTPAMEEYVEGYCFIQSTYYVPVHDYIPQNYFDRELLSRRYYQWIPFILILQAAMFYLPPFLWKATLRWHSVVNVNELIALAKKTRFMDNDEKQRAVQLLAQQLLDEVQVRRNDQLNRRRTCCSRLDIRAGTIRHCGCFVAILYIVIKALYVLNIILQFFFIKYVLGFSSWRYGWESAKYLSKGREWDETGLFPRVTYCDFEIRQVGNVHRNSVQCVLHMNLFFERVFVFLWFWNFSIAVVTAVNALYWTLSIFGPYQGTKLVQLYLPDVAKRSDIQSFIDTYQKGDGILLLRMLTLHAGEAVTTQLVIRLWEEFCEQSDLSVTVPVDTSFHELAD